MLLKREKYASFHIVYFTSLLIFYSKIDALMTINHFHKKYKHFLKRLCKKNIESIFLNIYIFHFKYHVPAISYAMEDDSRKTSFKHN